MKYVSDELTHFVGKSLPDDDARYEPLLKILGDGYLTTRPELRAKGATLVAERGSSDEALSSNRRVVFDQVGLFL